jgi:hypothetical protein
VREGRRGKLLQNKNQAHPGGNLCKGSRVIVGVGVDLMEDVAGGSACAAAAAVGGSQLTSPVSGAK